MSGTAVTVSNGIGLLIMGRNLPGNRLAGITRVVKVTMHLRAACTVSDQDAYYRRATPNHRYSTVNQVHETDYGLGRASIDRIRQEFGLRTIGSGQSRSG
jgi:hypothetical protein